MKKVFLSLLISLIALTVSAQIQRSFLGCTLTSSYQEVKDHLTQEKYDIGSDDDIIFVYNTKFAGFDCEWIAFGREQRYLRPRVDNLYGFSKE